MLRRPLIGAEAHPTIAPRTIAAAVKRVVAVRMIMNALRGSYTQFPPCARRWVHAESGRPRRSKMKAIVFAESGGPEVLTLADAPQPAARPGSVLIKNHAIGVNFADTRFRQGIYTVKPKLPDIPGMEVAGGGGAGGGRGTNRSPGGGVARLPPPAGPGKILWPALPLHPLPRT